jgi:hypothetical protein
MRTGAGLALICVGAILTFAVTTNTSVFNMHTAGWVLMIIGVAGLALPRRTYGWMGRRLVRRTRFYPDGRQVEEAAVPPYAAYNPGTSRIRAGLPARPTLLTEPLDDDPDTRPGYRPRANGETEVVEDLYEEP